MEICYVLYFFLVSLYFFRCLGLTCIRYTKSLQEKEVNKHGTRTRSPRSYQYIVTIVQEKYLKVALPAKTKGEMQNSQQERKRKRKKTKMKEARGIVLKKLIPERLIIDYHKLSLIEKENAYTSF